MKLFYYAERRVKVRRVRRVRNGRESSAQYKRYKEDARAMVHARLQHFNTLYGHTYDRVAIRDTRSRWGSCSKKGNLNFSYKLALLPQDMADYVIVHELCHLAEFNHSPKFWALVARALPEYKKRKSELRTYSLRHRTFQIVQ